MRFIVIDRVKNKVKSIADLPFSYEYPIEDDEYLVIGHDDFMFNLMSSDYFFNDGNFIEVSKK